MCLHDCVLPTFQVIKNPVIDHLPTGCEKIKTSFQSEDVRNPRELVPDDKPVVIVVGAMAHGSVSIGFRAFFFFFVYFYFCILHGFITKNK